MAIGIDGSTSFELGAFNRFGCEIHGFDHTIEKRPFARVTPNGPRQNVRWADWSHPMDHFQFAQLHAKGLGVHMNLPQMAKYFTRGQCCDVVKIDIEGDEFPVFLDGPDREANLRFLQKHVTQFLIEIHLRMDDSATSASMNTPAGFARASTRQASVTAGTRKLRRIADAFDGIGMRIFSNETNAWSLAFANVSSTEVSYLNIPRLMERRGELLNISFVENATAPAATEGSSAQVWSSISGLY